MPKQRLIIQNNLYIYIANANTRYNNSNGNNYTNIIISIIMKDKAMKNKDIQKKCIYKKNNKGYK